MTRAAVRVRRAYLMHPPLAMTPNGRRDFDWLAVTAAFVLALAGAGCHSERFSCLSEGCRGQGVALRVWIDSADWGLDAVRVYDVPAADRALFESEMTQGSGRTAPLIGEWETPLCRDFSEISLIDADVPDEAAGKEVGIVVDAWEKDCSFVLGNCRWAVVGFTFTTLTNGCQTVMMTPNLVP